MHHSEAFSKAYHPHYRIVAKDIFRSELKNAIGDAGCKFVSDHYPVESVLGY